MDDMTFIVQCYFRQRVLTSADQLCDCRFLLIKFIKTTKFMSNVLEAISKLKLKNSKNHFSNLVLYLPAYS